MCGIIAYLGNRTDAAKIAIEGLKSLEYRGYDSWGIAYKNAQDIKIHKEIGKIGDTDSEDTFPASSLALGHSRWATHGKPELKNAHPHTSDNGEIILVHNGIFENYLEHKKILSEKGHTFKTDCDTEVIANLIAEINKTHDFETSVKLACKEIHGRYAIVVLKKGEDKIIAARKGSPIIIGVNPEAKEYFVASDIPAFLPYTNRVVYLDDNQMAIIKSENGQAQIEFFDNHTEQTVEKRIIEIDWKAEAAEKGDFPHFMIKEIMEQKDTITRAVNQDQKTIQDLATAIEEAFGTYFIGCGTAGKVCMVAEYLFSKIAKKHINVSFGSEFPYHKHFLTDKSLIVAISQSGETADTLEALEIGEKAHCHIASIVNVESSTMARMSDIVIPIKAGPEKAVASTKATTSQLAIVTLLAYALDGRLEEGKELLIEAVSQINDMLNPRYEDHIMELAKKIQHIESMYIIGRGMNYPIALEAAIKLQEVSYIHAEGFAAGELKHGPLALISENTPVIVFVPNDEAKNETLSNTQEVKSRGGYIIGVSPENHEVFDFWIRVPDSGDASPITNIIPIQILAYYLAVLRQNDPDKPRNLAKSVTVK